MSFIKPTLSYLKRSFWLLALLSLPAAVALGFFIKPAATVTFLPELYLGEVYSYADIFWLVISKSTFKLIYPLFLVFIALLISVSLNLSVIEKHMRTGKLMIKKPLSEINSLFFPVLRVLFILLVITTVYTVLSISLSALLTYIISGWGSLNIGAGIVVTIFSFLLFCLVFYLFSPIVMVVPEMTIYGYSFTDSLARAYTLAGKNKLSGTVGIIFPFVFVGIIEFIVSFFTPPYFVCVLYRTALYILLISYVCAFIMNVMFNGYNLPRKDIKTYYYL